MTPAAVVAVDTNVLVSAIVSGGPPSRIVEQAVAGVISLVSPIAVLIELERALGVRFGHSPAEAHAACDGLRTLAVATPTSPPMVAVVTGYGPDDAILAAAAGAKADVLVTGDRRHMLPVGEYRGMRILTPQALLAELAR